jgi:predicted transcriptional regulator
MTSATSIHWNEDLIRGERATKPARSRRLPRDKIYIIKDIIVKLLGTGEMNKSMLLSMCGLNSKIHGEILDDLESRNLVAKKNTLNGAKEVSFYNVTHDGIQFYRNILSPFEEVFPRKKRSPDDYQEQWY